MEPGPLDAKLPEAALRDEPGRARERAAAPDGMEQAFRDARAQFEAIAEAFDGLVYVCSQDYVVEYMNRRFIERTGRDATGEKCYRALHDLGDICEWCVNDRVLKGETVRWEILRPKDDRWYSIVDVPIRHPDGRISKLALIADVDEGKRAEEALRESEECYRSLLDLSPEAVVVHSGGRIAYINRAGARLLGAADPTVPLGLRVTDFVDPEFGAIVRERIQRSYEDHERGDWLEERFLRFDGTPFDVRVATTPVMYRGEPASLLVISDITEYKRDQGALQRLNRELRAISNCNQTLMRAEDEQALLDDICRIVCDQAGYRMAWVGYAENDDAKTVRPVAWAGNETGYLAAARVTWADTEHGRGPTGAAIRSGNTVCVQDFTTDPQAVPWRENASQRGYRSSIALPLKDAGARTFGALTIYSTEPDAFTPDEMRLLEELSGDLAFGIVIVRARAERKRAEEELHDSEQKFRGFVEESSEGFTLVDEQGAIIEWNHAREKETGLPASQVIGQRIWDVLHQGLKPEVQTRERYERNRQLLLNALQTGKSPLFGNAFESEVVRQDGTRLFVQQTIFPIKTDKGYRIGSVTRDVTERTQAEEEIRTLNQELERRVTERTSELEAANKELEAFAYSVSHDLRAPLRAVAGFGRILLEDHTAGLDAEAQRVVGVMIENTDRMGRLIDDLLSFSRLSRTAMATRPVNMESLARSVADELLALEPERQIEFQVGRLHPAVGDAAMLRQVLVNLLGNSLKFTRTRAVARIEVSSAVDGTMRTYAVRDNGVGFDMAYVDKLFKVFQRLHRTAEFEGTGIGLAIVARIVDRHGGKAGAESVEGDGATFWFTLPGVEGGVDKGGEGGEGGENEVDGRPGANSTA